MRQALEHRGRASEGSPFGTSRQEHRRATFDDMHDTTAAAEQVQLAAIRSLEPVERLRQALELSESVRALALSRLREIHPDRTELELVELLLGVTLVPRSPA